MRELLEATVDQRLSRSCPLAPSQICSTTSTSCPEWLGRQDVDLQDALLPRLRGGPLAWRWNPTMPLLPQRKASAYVADGRGGRPDRGDDIATLQIVSVRATRCSALDRDGAERGRVNAVFGMRTAPVGVVSSVPLQQADEGDALALWDS